MTDVRTYGRTFSTRMKKFYKAGIGRRGGSSLKPFEMARSTMMMISKGSVQPVSKTSLFSILHLLLTERYCNF
jgi:hypothetical protein